MPGIHKIDAFREVNEYPACQLLFILTFFFNAKLQCLPRLLTALHLPVHPRDQNFIFAPVRYFHSTLCMTFFILGQVLVTAFRDPNWS